MKAYTAFADFYDGLTANVDYKSRADYIEKLLAFHNHDFGLCVDLACGTGSLTIELAKRGIDIYGIDGSSQMLSQAQMKAYDEELSVLFLCQKMQSIDLYGTVDTCLCTLDSINHLTEPDLVQKTFDRVSLFMNPNGLFVFDVNTVYKHQEILSGNTFVYDTDDVYCVWQNTPVDETLVKIDLDFFEYDGKAYHRTSESFCERAYSNVQLAEMLQKAGFAIEGMYGDMTLDLPKENEQRIIYIARKL